MGDSEFVGGGSVTWKVRPSKGDPGHGNPHGASGKDKDPVGTGFFKVFDNGTQVYEQPEAAGHKIRVEWGPESAATPQTLASKSAMKSSTAKSTKKKAKGTKKKATATKRKAK
jgi:hypothetical protein